MKLFEIIKIACETCGHENNYREYKVINPENNPELKKAIMDDSIFRYTCSKCHNETYYHHPLFYYDPIKKYALVYTDNEDQFLDEMSALRQGRLFKDYKIRMCNTWMSFKETIMAFDHDLDDRLLIIYKYILLKDFRTRYPDAGKTIAFYDHRDEEMMVVVSENVEPKFFVFPERWYKAKMHDRLIQRLLRNDMSYLIDESFNRKVKNLTLYVNVATVETKTEVLECLISPFDHAYVHDHVYVNHTEGIITSINKIDVRDIDHRTYIIEKVLPTTDIRIDHDRRILESLFEEIEESITRNTLMEILSLICDVKVYMPLLVRDDTIELILINTSDRRSLVPIYTDIEGLKDMYPDTYIIEEDFYHLLDHDLITSDGFIFNPHLNSMFIADERFLTLLRQYLNTRKSRLN